MPSSNDVVAGAGGFNRIEGHDEPLPPNPPPCPTPLSPTSPRPTPPSRRRSWPSAARTTGSASRQSRRCGCRARRASCSSCSPCTTRRRVCRRSCRGSTVPALAPADVYRIGFGRGPEDATLALPRPGYDAREHLRATLLSNEFRAGLLGSFLAAFPEKRRDVFIHVPKTAGTDLTLNVWPRRVSFPVAIDSVGTNQQALDYCARVARLMPVTETIFVHGHIEFGRYLAVAGARLGDRFFTTVREPVDLLISQVSDLLGQLLRDTEAASAQTRTWLGYLGLDRVPTDLAEPQLKELWATALRNPKLAEPNNICRFLSKSGAVRYERAMANVVAHNVELTTTAQYPRWLAERWGVASRTRHNASRRMLQRDEAVRMVGAAIRGQTAEDEKFYAVVEWALAKKGGVSITGGEIADLVGPALFSGFADELVAGQAARPVAVAPVAVAPVAVAPPRPAEPDVVAHDPATFPVPAPEAAAFATAFGRAGDAARYQEAGWANAEQGYTWTNAPLSLLRLPRPAEPGTYRLCARVAPFVAPGRLAAQRVAVAVNGTRLGEVGLERPSVLACRVGWEVLSRAEAVEVSFAMPDAAQPAKVTGHPNDARLLGLSFHRLWLAGPLPEAEAESPPPPPRAAPASTAELMLRFESIGENCEFGLVQRRAGVEPLGLFRFASAPLPLLMRALAARFEGFGKPEHLVVEVSPNGREYMVFEKHFQFRYHAWVGVHEQTAEQVLAREARRLPFLVRKLLADLAEGGKIFVFHGMQPLGEAEAGALAQAIRGFGPGTLLWVELADAAHPPGSVARLGEGLLKGHVDRFAPGDNAHDISMPSWIEVCTAAAQA